MDDWTPERAQEWLKSRQPWKEDPDYFHRIRVTVEVIVDKDDYETVVPGLGFHGNWLDRVAKQMALDKLDSMASNDPDSEADRCDVVKVLY